MGSTLSKLVLVSALLINFAAWAAETEPALLPVYLEVMKSGKPEQKAAVLKSLGREKETTGVVELLLLGLSGGEPDLVKLASAKAVHDLRPTQRHGEFVRVLLPLLDSTSADLRRSSAEALYATSGGYELTEEQTRTVRGHLEKVDESTIPVIWILPTLPEKNAKALRPALRALLENQTGDILNAVANSLSVADLAEPSILSTLLKRLEKESDPQGRRLFLGLLRTAPVTEAVKTALLAGIRDKDGRVRYVAANTVGNLGAKAAPLVAQLLQAVREGGEGRGAAARAVLYLAPLVPRADAFTAIHSAYLKETTGFKTVFLVGVLSFADASLADGKKALDEALDASKKILESKVRTPGELRTFLELLPYAGENASALLPGLLSKYDDFLVDLGGGQKDLNYQVSIFHLALSVAPGKGETEVIKLLRRSFKAKENNYTPISFDSACSQFGYFSATDRRGLLANLDRLLAVVEDAAEDAEFRLYAATLFSYTNGMGKPYLPRLKGLQAKATGDIKERLDRAITDLQTP